MRLVFCVLMSVALIAACSNESPTTFDVQSSITVQSQGSSETDYAYLEEPSYEAASWNPDIECPTALEPLFLTLPALSQIEGKPLTSQRCGVNVATKVYGSIDGAEGAAVIYLVTSYTTRYADLPNFSAGAADEFLALQRQGWTHLLDNVREALRWAAEPDIYTDHQLARMPRELLWDGSMPTLLDNGTGIWALTIWVTPDVAVNVALYDPEQPDLTAEAALLRLTPLADALNFDALR